MAARGGGEQHNRVAELRQHVRPHGVGRQHTAAWACRRCSHGAAFAWACEIVAVEAAEEEGRASWRKADCLACFCT